MYSGSAHFTVTFLLKIWSISLGSTISTCDIISVSSLLHTSISSQSWFVEVFITVDVLSKDGTLVALTAELFTDGALLVPSKSKDDVVIVEIVISCKDGGLFLAGVDVTTTRSLLGLQLKACNKKISRG